jgi:hypothetical protein
MKTWTICCVVAGLMVWTVANGQAPQDPFAAKPQQPASESPNRSPDPLTPPVAPIPSSDPVPLPGTATAAPPAPQPQAIDDLLNQLADIRARKAELEKQEQATIKVLRERLKAQKERLAKMGVALEDDVPKPQVEKADLDIGPAKGADKK